MSNFKDDVLGFNSSNNIYCSDTVILGDPASTEIADIDIVGQGGRTVSVNGVIPSAGGGALPTDLTLDTLTVNTSITNEGQMEQKGQLLLSDDVISLSGSGKAITADILIGRDSVGTALVSTGALTTSGATNIGGTMAVTAINPSFSAGLDVTGNISCNGNIVMSGVGAITGSSSNILNNVDCTSLQCVNGTELQRSITTPRVFFRASGGYSLIQPATGALANDLIMEGTTAGARLLVCKAGGNPSLDTNHNLTVEDNGTVRINTTGQLNTPRIDMAYNSGVNPCYSIEQPPIGGGITDPELTIIAPTADSKVLFVDELGNSLLEIEKDIIVVHKGIELIDGAVLGFGEYNFNPEQITRTITNFVINTSQIPAGAITQTPLFVTGNPALGATSDWENVNTGATGLSFNGTQGFFYKVTLTGDSTANPAPYLNNFACMFDFVLRTAQDNAPRLTIPIHNYSFQAMQPDPTSVGSFPVVTCVPGNTNWTVYINFNTFPAMTIPNLVIKVTRMPY